MTKFSIIVPTYNRGDKIALAISSVFAQQFQDWELIVVDDGSTDNTSAEVECFLSDARVSYFHRENRGVSAARNFGVSNSRGEYLVFLDSDDAVEKSWLADFYQLISSSTQPVGYLSCGYVLNGEKKRPRAGREFCPSPYLSAPAGTFCVLRSVFVAVGGYDQNLRQSENWEMAARALTHCATHGYCVLHTNNCNVNWYNEKTDSERSERILARANAYLYMHTKYADGGLLHHKAHRFLLGAAVSLARIGHISESRRWFYKSFVRYPSVKGVLRLLCFEIPIVRRRLWPKTRSGAKENALQR